MKQVIHRGNKAEYQNCYYTWSFRVQTEGKNNNNNKTSKVKLFFLLFTHTHTHKIKIKNKIFTVVFPLYLHPGCI